MKVLVFGGTTEGRLLARELSALGAQVTVSVATALGAEELRGVPPLTVCVGRKDTRQMRGTTGATLLCNARKKSFWSAPHSFSEGNVPCLLTIL